MTVERMQDGQVFGVASVTNLLEGVSFPVSKQELIQRFGRQEVHWTQDTSESFENLIKGVPDETFYSASDVVSAISRPH